MPGLRRAVKDVAAHYAARNIPFIVAGWQKRRRGTEDEASIVRRIHLTFVAPKKVLADAPRYDPAPVLGPRPTALPLPVEGVVQQGQMLALVEDDTLEEVV